VPKKGRRKPVEVVARSPKNDLSLPKTATRSSRASVKDGESTLLETTGNKRRASSRIARQIKRPNYSGFEAQEESGDDYYIE